MKNVYKFDIEPLETNFEFEDTLESFDEFSEETQDIFPEYGEEESWSFDSESDDQLQDESLFRGTETSDWEYESALDEVTDALPTCENRIRTVTVWLNAFIPRDVSGLTRKVPDSIVKLDPSMAGKTMFVTQFFCGLTDQRSLSPDINASSRMHSETKMDLDKPRIIYQNHRIDPTIQVDCMTGLVLCRGTSSTSPMNFSFLGVTPAKEIMIRVKGSQGPACPTSKTIKKVGQFLLNAKIDYEGTFFIKRVARNYVDIGFLGYVDLFPAYEFVVKLNDSNPVHLGGKLPAAGSSPVTHLGTRQKIHFVRRLWLKCSNGKQVAGLYERIIN